MEAIALREKFIKIAGSLGADYSIHDEAFNQAGITTETLKASAAVGIVNAIHPDSEKIIEQRVFKKPQVTAIPGM